ncbi:MAG: helix-turn-helix transcriptional regulator [Gammaproteobacteria bacterium]|nr:helix-turn-helix transcriptional regulator [Gammaproteobacteria bacterium]
MNLKVDNLLESLGMKLKQARLNANRTQKEIADIIGMSRTAIEGAEKGKCTLSTFVNILVALDIDDQLDSFLPESPPSPVLLAKALGNKRKRASSAREENNQVYPAKDDLGW